MLDLAAALASRDWAATIACNASVVLAAAAADGVPTMYVDAPHRPSPLPRRSEIHAWRTRLKELEPDLVHLNSVSAMPALLVAAVQCRVPIVLHQHILDDEFARLYSLMHQASAIVTISEVAREALLSDGYPAGRLHRFANGVRPVSYAASATLRALLGLSATATVAVSVGSLIARKGHDRVIAAMRHATARDPSLHLAIIGSGEDESSLQALLSASDLRSRVHLVGQRDDVQQLLRSADFLVSGAREEVQPLSIIEALMVGLPIVASSIPAHVEMIEHEVTGLVADADDAEQFGAAIVEAATNREWRVRASTDARRVARERYDFDAYVGRFEALYASLLRQPRRAFGFPLALRWMRGYTRWVGSAVSRRLGRRPTG